jgi:hypothetical protein
MYWGFLALAFVISVAVGVGVAARKQHRAAKTPPKEMN